MLAADESTIGLEFYDIVTACMRNSTTILAQSVWLSESPLWISMCGDIKSTKPKFFCLIKFKGFNPIYTKEHHSHSLVKIGEI